MKNIKKRIIKKQYMAVIFFLGLMLVMVIRMGKNIKTSEIKSSIEMKTQDELGEKFEAEYIGFNMDDSASESGVETEAETVSERLPSFQLSVLLILQVPRRNDHVFQR